MATIGANRHSTPISLPSVTNCAKLPLREFTVEDLPIMIGQHIGMEYFGSESRSSSFVLTH